MKRMPICEIKLSTGYRIPIDFGKFDEDTNHLTNALIGEMLLPAVKKSGYKKAVKVLQNEIIDICEKLSNKNKTALLITIIWHLVCIKHNRLIKYVKHEYN